MNKLLSFLLFIGIFACSQPKPNNSKSKKDILTHKSPVNSKPIQYGALDDAVFGMGCFWCTEAVFEELEGVASVESGYTGGKTKNPTYDDISNKETGHAEVALIKFDPKIISYETLLDVFWTTHNPTTLNKQGADYGTQYRSAIFYTSDEQRIIAEKSKKDVAPTIWDNPIVTEIVPLTKFYTAEEYHQNYYAENPNYGYCVAVINPKIDKLRKKFSHLLKGQNLIKNNQVLTKGKYNKLSKFDENIIENKGTERAFSGNYWNNKKKGVYICKRCNQPLFKSDSKFNSKTGWPSFDDMYEEGAVKEIPDADGYRIEIVCGNCGGHLGHVFKGEGFTDKNTRHCVNSASLEFVE